MMHAIQKFTLHALHKVYKGAVPKFQRERGKTKRWGSVLAAQVTQQNWKIPYPTSCTNINQFHLTRDLGKGKASLLEDTVEEL